MWDEIKDRIRGFGWAQFHFLRPRALWLLLPLGLVLLLLLAVSRDPSNWKRIVASHLRPYLFTISDQWAVFWPLSSFVLGCGLGILALAAPAWRKKTMPEQKIQAVVLVAMDVSQSMLATDIQPNRLRRANFKLNDFLDANPRAPVGLVAFAGTAHPVLPFTADYALIRQQAASLSPRIMPLQGTAIGALMGVVDSVMSKIEAPSTIFLMTDVVDSEEAVQLENYMRSGRHHLELLLFSTSTGAIVPGRPAVRSVQDPGVLSRLAGDTAVSITPLTLDSSDVASIAKRISGKLVFKENREQKAEEWEDEGPLFLLPLLLLSLFTFRRGWVIPWCWL